MNAKIIINDSLVTVPYSDNSTWFYGESKKKSEPCPVASLSPQIRHETYLRLKDTIVDLMTNVHQSYLIRLASLPTQEDEFIERLLTQEYFFYTYEPLMLTEFQDLLNDISSYAKMITSNIHLILSSFAVKTIDSNVMNVTLHLICGQNPQISLIVKNYRAKNEIAYCAPDLVKQQCQLLGILDNTDIHDCLPILTVNDQRVPFSFDNIIYCSTPKNHAFLTAIDVCIDHSKRVAKNKFKMLALHDPDLLQMLVSHVVVSNWTRLVYGNFISTPVIHVDPVMNPLNEHYKPFFDTTSPATKLSFGRDLCRISNRKEYQLGACDNIVLAELLSSALDCYGVTSITLQPLEIQVPEMLYHYIKGYLTHIGFSFSTKNHNKIQLINNCHQLSDTEKSTVINMIKFFSAPEKFIFLANIEKELLLKNLITLKTFQLERLIDEIPIIDQFNLTETYHHPIFMPEIDFSFNNCGDRDKLVSVIRKLNKDLTCLPYTTITDQSPSYHAFCKGSALQHCTTYEQIITLYNTDKIKQLKASAHIIMNQLIEKLPFITEYHLKYSDDQIYPVDRIKMLINGHAHALRFFKITKLINNNQLVSSIDKADKPGTFYVSCSQQLFLNSLNLNYLLSRYQESMHSTIAFFKNNQASEVPLCTTHLGSSLTPF